jgi:hypothetical protein
MKTKVSKMLTAAALVAFGFGLGFFMAPQAAQGVGCINGGDKSAFLDCPGSYQFMGSPHAGTDVTECKITSWITGGKTYHSARVTVVKK